MLQFLQFSGPGDAKLDRRLGKGRKSRSSEVVSCSYEFMSVGVGDIRIILNRYGFGGARHGGWGRYHGLSDRYSSASGTVADQALQSFTG